MRRKLCSHKMDVFDIMQHDNAVTISINAFVLGGEFSTISVLNKLM